ncbi:MAG TPA: SDR family NAD(P)-dependent oxidoreductase [Micromonosporaceae bacterium]|nr:SDR family NAD(P)-dependent oxidoreductase [Micromonosporaceae bacterium]
MVVTGANSGIGLAAAKAFARGGARVVLVGRDQTRLDDALALVSSLALDPAAAPAAFRADFAALDEVRKLAAALNDAYPSIDVLANNAGGSFARRTTTVDGFELTIQVNHLAPFLLTNLLRARLAGGRIINTASDAHSVGRLDPANLNYPGRFRTFPVYGASKQANILFAAELARRWPEINAYSYHPGVVRTRFGRESIVVSTFYKVMPGLRTPTEGADTMVWLAGTSITELEDGGYYVDRRRRSPSAAASDPAKADALWAASEAAVGL